MGKTTANRWLVERVDPALVEHLAARHVPNSRAAEMGADILGNPHREDDEGSSSIVTRTFVCSL
jgi:hypothetical protein